MITYFFPTLLMSKLKYSDQQDVLALVEQEEYAEVTETIQMPHPKKEAPIRSEYVSPFREINDASLSTLESILGLPVHGKAVTSKLKKPIDASKEAELLEESLDMNQVPANLQRRVQSIIKHVRVRDARLGMLEAEVNNNEEQAAMGLQE